MTFKIITADERIEAQSGIKGQIWGKYGIGKTTLLTTLDPKTTLMVDLEAGMKAVQGWGGLSVSLRTWDECREIACWAGGPNPALRPEQPYSESHYAYVVNQYGEFPKHIQTVFIDSTSNAGRYCMQWASSQEDAKSQKTGKVDMRGAYGLLGREIVAWADQWQHIGRLNVWLVGGLEEKTDDFNRAHWVPMIEGSKGANAIPYIFDEVISMVDLKTDDGTPYRALVTRENPWGYPAKDRSGRLSMIEEPHLGRLMAKISDGTRKRRPIVSTLPEQQTGSIEQQQPTKQEIAA